MRFAARLLFSFFILYLLSFTLLAAPAHAQYANPYTTPNTDTNVPANLHTYTQSVILEVLSGLTCQIIGMDPLSSSTQCLGFNPATGRVGYVSSNGGAVGFASTMISTLYTPPLHAGDYINYMASGFGIAKRTYAAPNGSIVTGCAKNGNGIGNGCGFDHLTPLLNVWTTFRNLSYLVFVLVFIAIGFMIMLRVKIDPRTVMSIENQIPKLIIALLLVTFSYAIAGFLIDMMNVTDYLVINIVTNTQTQDGNTDTVKSIQNAEKSDLAGGNPFGFINDVIPPNADGTPGGLLGISIGSASGVRHIIQNLFTPQKISDPSNSKNSGWAWGAGIGTGTIVGLGCAAIAGTLTFGLAILPCLAVGAGVGIITGVSVGGVDVGDIVTAAVGTVIGVGAGILAFLIIAIALLIAMFRVWFGLLMAYVGILLDVVFAPFWIIAGLFPGSKVGFGTWFRDIASNLIAFPVTIVMFLLAGIFMNNFASSNSYTVFTPPLIGNPNGSGLGKSPLAYLIALGMIMITPGIVTMMRELLQAPKQPYLQTIATGLGAGATPFSEGIKAISNYNRLDIGGKAKWRGVIQGLLHI